MNHHLFKKEYIEYIENNEPFLKLKIPDSVVDFEYVYICALTDSGDPDFPDAPEILLNLSEVLQYSFAAYTDENQSIFILNDYMVIDVDKSNESQYIKFATLPHIVDKLLNSGIKLTGVEPVIYKYKNLDDEISQVVKTFELQFIFNNVPVNLIYTGSIPISIDLIKHYETLDHRLNDTILSLYEYMISKEKVYITQPMDAKNGEVLYAADDESMWFLIHPDMLYLAKKIK